MIAVIACTLVAVASIGSFVALVGSLRGARAHSTGRSAEPDALPLTPPGFGLFLFSLAGLAVLWLTTGR